jgi:hypothetical protein
MIPGAPHPRRVDAAASLAPRAKREKALHGQGRLGAVWASEPDAVGASRGTLVIEGGLRTGGAGVIGKISGRAPSRTVTAWRSTRW